MSSSLVWRAKLARSTDFGAWHGEISANLENESTGIGSAASEALTTLSCPRELVHRWQWPQMSAAIYRKRCVFCTLHKQRFRQGRIHVSWQVTQINPTKGVAMAWQVFYPNPLGCAPRFPRPCQALCLGGRSQFHHLQMVTRGDKVQPRSIYRGHATLGYRISQISHRSEFLWDKNVKNVQKQSWGCGHFCEQSPACR